VSDRRHAPGIDEANGDADLGVAISGSGVPPRMPFISAITVLMAVWLDDAFLSAPYAGLRLAGPPDDFVDTAAGGAEQNYLHD